MGLQHLPALATCRDVRLVGIHSRSTHRSEALIKSYHGLRVFLSIDALCTHTRADLVVIAVPEYPAKRYAIKLSSIPVRY